MPRPRKCRMVCCLPQVNEFSPTGMERHPDNCVILAVDEYEAIRLIDYESLSQEDCSAYMHISRTTVQQIYTKARCKIAHALVDGSILRIEGGVYHLCDGNEGHPGCCRCHRTDPSAKRSGGDPPGWLP